jgi:serine/threonine protein kinase
MRLTTTCPNDGTLVEFLQGKLPEEVAMRIAFHAGGCRDCAARLENLRSSDPLLGVMRNPPLPLPRAEQERVQSLLSYRPDADSLSPRVVRTLTLADAVAETPAEGTDPPVGSQHALGPYRLIRVLGTGGMGTVYEAIDTQLQRRVAVKVMNASVSRSPVARQRFLREARAVASLRTSHIVTVFQTGEARDVLYMAMELLEGETLQDRCLREGIIPLRETLRIGRETAQGLAAAHAKGLIHRDIKPANIWLEAPRGRVKILDFGLVRPVDASDLRLTPDGVGVGTPGYVAPEQVQGRGVDARADLFSLGCVLYRMLSGRPPFNGNTILEVLTALAVDTPPRIRELNPEVPAELEKLITAMMAKRPELRPSTATVVVDWLSRIETDLNARCDFSPILELPPNRSQHHPHRSRLRATLTASAILGVAAAAGIIAALCR